MTNEEKLKVNMAAAKMLGYELNISYGIVMVTVRSASNRVTEKVFGIFNNPADRMAVVEGLCERGITIRKQAKNDYRSANWRAISRKGHRTYVDALAAAVLEASND